MNSRISAMPRRIEAVRRLVEDQQVGVLEQRRGDAEPLLHPLRVRPEAVAGPLAETDLFEGRRDPLLRHAGVTGEHAQVVARREERVQGRGLDHRSDPRQPLGRAGRGAEHDGAAARRPHEAEEHAQGRRLAGAVRPEEAVDLAPPDAEREPVDREDLLAVALGEIAGLDHELVLGHPPAFLRLRARRVNRPCRSKWRTRHANQVVRGP